MAKRETSIAVTYASLMDFFFFASTSCGQRFLLEKLADPFA